MFQRLFLGPLNERWRGLADLRPAEFWTMMPLLALLLLIGVYPGPLMNLANTTATQLVAVFQRALS
jgi:NADH-quinone oxidoreductase subunit M